MLPCGKLKRKTKNVTLTSWWPRDNRRFGFVLTLGLPSSACVCVYSQADISFRELCHFGVREREIEQNKFASFHDSGFAFAVLPENCFSPLAIKVLCESNAYVQVVVKHPRIKS